MIFIVHKISMALRGPRMSEAASRKQAKVLRRTSISEMETVLCVSVVWMWMAVTERRKE